MQTIKLKDYRPPAYLVEAIHLRIELDPGKTRVHSRILFYTNPAVQNRDRTLSLNGRQLDLKEVLLDGLALNSGGYRLGDDSLIIEDVPDRFTLETLVELDPEGNTALEGLYRASDIYCTQCEPQGFRKITFFPDRPDVMARYTTTLVGDTESSPVLLANGNLVDSGPLEDNRHFATFEDPFPKPSYLFAMVAGRLEKIDASFMTMSDKKVSLQIFVEERNRYKCDHAMTSLKKAMRWDEETYGLEYDLDEYKIVAVDDFNMGAMENKGLNVFNSKYVLAQPETATDADYQGIEGVIGHEYFHNWTGNRVTCRDWFQLSLKEGLTVFRDQEFSADMGSRAVKRIADVRLLRNVQFPEDAGPMAHSVRPESYVEINNFYTATVYNKGAEVIRMYQSLLGEDGFRKGLDLYFERHDGRAVTTADFLAAMADANQADLEQFRLWYSQAGTPTLDVRGEYIESASEFRLHVRQSCPEDHGQTGKKPFLIPLKVGLVDQTGESIPLQLAGENRAEGTTRTLRVTAENQTFDFVNVPSSPVPSLLREFSAPVRVQYPYSREELAFLFAHDDDAFNRWEAGQRLATAVILEMVEDIEDGWQDAVPTEFLTSFRTAMQDKDADPALLALALTLPGEPELAEAMVAADPVSIHAARQDLRRALARELKDEFDDTLRQMQGVDEHSLDAAAVGRRGLKNLCLSYLVLLDDEDIHRTCFDQCANAGNMTDRMTALTGLVHNRLSGWEESLAAFFHQFQNDPLVVDKWFTLQATVPLHETLTIVVDLLGHPAFTMRNPNRVRSLVGAFAQGNPRCFHDLSGAGYAFVADRIIELDAMNPQIAARLAIPLSRWKRYAPGYQTLMIAQLERLNSQAGLSNDVREIVTKSLETYDEQDLS